jgi:hypothetical protein
VIPKPIAERLAQTTINKIGLLKRDARFMEACEKLLVHWADLFTSTAKSLTKETLAGDSGTYATPGAEIRHWEDVYGVYNAIITELNDIIVAKIDGILVGTEAHNVYLRSLTLFKANWVEAKELSDALGQTKKTVDSMKTLKRCAEMILLLLESI